MKGCLYPKPAVRIVRLEYLRHRHRQSSSAFANVTFVGTTVTWPIEHGVIFSVSENGVESGGKERETRRPFHSD